MFVNGCAPGGGASNYWTLLLDGNLPVSVTMTFISTLAALGWFLSLFTASVARSSRSRKHAEVSFLEYLCRVLEDSLAFERTAQLMVN